MESSERYEYGTWMIQMWNKYFWTGIAPLPECPMLQKNFKHQNSIQLQMWLVLLLQTLSIPLQASTSVGRVFLVKTYMYWWNRCTANLWFSFFLVIFNLEHCSNISINFTAQWAHTSVWISVLFTISRSNINNWNLFKLSVFLNFGFTYVYYRLPTFHGNVLGRSKYVY